MGKSSLQPHGGHHARGPQRGRRRRSRRADGHRRGRHGDRWLQRGDQPACDHGGEHQSYRAHDLVKELQGPFDFLFSDADKEWYKNYFIDIDPKLKAGGCFTAHNISDRGRGYGGYGGQAAFLEYVRSLKNYE
ncbi:MAG: hypothetical protein HGB17_13725, partial [Syntrophobacteraceae bacterium]|nr:hypothetical protein [Syntrophobacteraceae bacterium]